MFKSKIMIALYFFTLILLIARVSGRYYEGPYQRPYQRYFYPRAFQPLNSGSEYWNSERQTSDYRSAAFQGTQVAQDASILSAGDEPYCIYTNLNETIYMMLPCGHWIFDGFTPYFSSTDSNTNSLLLAAFYVRPTIEYANVFQKTFSFHIFEMYDSEVPDCPILTGKIVGDLLASKVCMMVWFNFTDWEYEKQYYYNRNMVHFTCSPDQFDEEHLTFTLIPQLLKDPDPNVVYKICPNRNTSCDEMLFATVGTPIQSAVAVSHWNPKTRKD